MKKLFITCLLFIAISLHAQTDFTPTLRPILLEQLKTTHNVKDWFVPPSIAGLTPEQANWKDSTDNHSIAQLTTHLIFWNKQSLDKFNWKKQDAFDGNNKETFAPVNAQTWNAAIQQLDSILTACETILKTADEKKAESWYSTIAHWNA